MNSELETVDQRILEKLYDIVRYVKPVHKKCNQAGMANCFSVWSKNVVCENCISMRALQEKKVVMKLEYNDNRVYMITAVPASDSAHEDQVIELIRDVTNENLIDIKNMENEEAIREKINRLNQEIIIDPLTKAYNRRFMDERLPYEFVKSCTSKKPMGFILADIDHFKKVNDNYGHIAGDQVLISFAEIIKSKLDEPQDWTVRYGGEEFLIFMPGVTAADLINKADAIRTAVENRVFLYDDLEIHLTASFGVYSIVPEPCDDFDQVKTYINNADKALYHSKQTGRNKTSSYPIKD